jgi:hypothetical protein
MGYHPSPDWSFRRSSGVGSLSGRDVGAVVVNECLHKKFALPIDFVVLFRYIIYRTTTEVIMNIKVKEERENEGGFFVSLCEGFGLLAAYFMVFYFLWEGLLVHVGAK